MPKKKAEKDVWEHHKDTILNLYIKQNKPLKEVEQIMAEKGFKKNKPQYERIFKKWNVTKNIQSEEWRTIFCRLQEREKQHKSSHVKVRGVLISQARLQKEKQRHAYQTTHERFALKVRPPPRPKTPPGVEVFTPPPLSTHDDESDAPEQDVVPVVTMLSSDDSNHRTENSPWWQHLNLINPLSEERKNVDATERAPFAMQDWMNEALNDVSIHPDMQMGTSEPIQVTDGAIVAASTMGHAAPQSKLIRLCKNMISRALNMDSAKKSILRSMQDEHVLPIFEYLLHLKLPTIDAFAQKLLVPAAIEGNFALIKILINSGVDANMRMSSETAMTGKFEFKNRSVTALYYAVYNRRQDLLEFLLRHGANDWRAEFRGASEYVVGSILDVVIEGMNQTAWTTHPTKKDPIMMIDYNMLKTLLEYRSRLFLPSQEGSLRTLRLAILQNRLDYVNLLLQHVSGLIDDAKRNPWILLEAAASIQGIAMFQELLKIGLDMNVTDKSGNGSPVAAAVKHSNIELVRYLLRAGVDVNGVAFGLGGTNVHGDITSSEKALEDLHGMASLHIAVRESNSSLTRLLLDYGANANQSCAVYPIQLAAWSGNIEVLRFLLDAHADVNAIPYDNNLYTFGKQHVDPAWGVANRTAMRLAFERNMLQTVEMLRTKGGSLFPPGFESSAEEEGWDPLSAAFQNHNAGLVRFVLRDMFGDIWTTERDLQYHLPLILGNHLMELKKASPGSFQAICYLAVMCAGISLGRVDVVRQLLYAMISKFGELQADYGNRALILAVREHPTNSLISLFMTAGISPFGRIELGTKELDEVDEQYMFWKNDSAFEVAVEHQRTDILKLFLEIKPAVLNQEEQLLRKRQLCAGYALALRANDPDLRSMIVGDGLEVDEIDQITGVQGYVQQHLYSALQETARDMEYDELEWLIRRGAKPDRPARHTPDKSGLWTPLQYAAANEPVWPVRMLIDAGADVNAAATPISGATALQSAAGNGNTELVRLLLQAGACVNASPAEYNGRTAIEGAAEWGHVDVVRDLLKAGANIQGRNNKNYRRTLYRAWKNKHYELGHMIQSWKVERYGAEDCESIELLQKSMSVHELTFANEAAVREHKWRIGEYDAMSGEEYDSGDESEDISVSSAEGDIA